MQKITTERVTKLLEAPHASPVVTIYLPTHIHATPPHITENQIRYKNCFNRAIDELNKEQGNEQIIEALQSELKTRLEDTEFWENQTLGLLICAYDNNVQTYNLPVDTEEYVSVDTDFHVAPILGLLQEARNYYILTVARHEPKLYKGDMYGLKQTNVQLPESVVSALHLDEPNNKTENQGSARGTSMHTGGFNGRGGSRDPREEDRLRFFREVDKIVYEKTNHDFPLLLAGVVADTAEYRKISNYPRILRGTIGADLSSASLETLYEQAKDIIQHEIIDASRARAIEEYEQADPERIAVELPIITEAANQGRVDKLLARLIRYTTDTIRDKAVAARRITFPEPHISRLLNRLACKVWRMGGTVVPLLDDQLPGNTMMVARLRY